MPGNRGRAPWRSSRAPDGTPDFTSPHQKGFRFADTDDPARIAAAQAYEAKRQCLADAWKHKGEPRDGNKGAHSVPRMLSLDQARAVADAAYEDRRQRLGVAQPRLSKVEEPMQREVDMAQRDPKTGKLTSGRETVETEVVHIRHNGQGADRILNDVVGGRIILTRGQTVTVELSKAGADDLRRQMESGAGTLELVEAPA